MKRARISIALSVILSSVAGAQVYPGKDWETNPHALSPTILKRVDNYVRALDTTGFVIVKGGKIAYSYGNTHELSYLASSRKSVLSMLYGKYVENGTIDLNKTVGDLGMDDLPAKGKDGKVIDALLPIEKTAKVRDLIMARSGVYHPASNGGDLLAFAPPRGSKKPGEFWLYSNWDFNAAGYAFEKMTGKKIFDALRDDLAKPVGMQDFDRHRQQYLGDLKVSRYPAYHMWLSVRDMARLGLLMEHDGKWKDQQLVPADWVRESTSVLTPYTEFPVDAFKHGPWGYGYLWWPWAGDFNTGAFAGAYTSRGAFGQYIAVMPAIDVVAAHKVVPVNQFVADEDWNEMLHRVAGDVPASEIVLPILFSKGRAAALDKYALIKSDPHVIEDESDLFAAGVALDRAGRPDDAIRALNLNLALYKSDRSKLALAHAQQDAGNVKAAIATYRSMEKVGFWGSRAKVALASMGQPVDGHSFLSRYSRGAMDKVVGRYKNPAWRYVVERDGGRLHIREIDPMGDLNDDYLAFPDSRGGYYVPYDGTSIKFVGKDIVRTVGKEEQRGTRVGK